MESILITDQPTFSMGRWSNEKTLLFVKLYRQYECLWNPESPIYKNQIARTKAYQDFLQNLNDESLTIKSIKTKIKNLRSTYHQQIKKIKDSQQSGASSSQFTPSLLWFNEMNSFLFGIPTELRSLKSTITSIEFCCAFYDQKMRWGENETVEFVKLYLLQECLWNPESENYRCKFQMQEAYKALASAFYDATNILLDEREVRVKIRNLRATYNQELVKIKRRSTPTYQHKPTIKWFEDWHRCFKDFVSFKPEASDDKQGSTDDSQKIWISGEGDNNDNDAEDSKDPFVSPTDDNYIFLLKTEPEEQSSKQESSLNPFKIRKRKVKRSPSTDRSEKTYRGSMDSNCESTSREDEFDIYGKYIASQLRGMGLQRALRVQLQIQSIVSEARLEHLTSNET